LVHRNLRKRETDQRDPSQSRYKFRLDFVAQLGSKKSRVKSRMLKRGKSETVRADLRRLSAEAKTLHVEALAIADETRSIALSAVEKGWQCGKRLNAMKKILGHGHWLPYLRTHLPEISQSTAQRYMKIDRDNPNAARVQDLPFDSILTGPFPP
jgi:Protein of unknown function (DUF3102)